MTPSDTYVRNRTKLSDLEGSAGGADDRRRTMGDTTSAARVTDTLTLTRCTTVTTKGPDSHVCYYDNTGRMDHKCRYSEVFDKSLLGHQLQGLSLLTEREQEKAS